VTWLLANACRNSFELTADGALAIENEQGYSVNRSAIKRRSSGTASAICADAVSSHV
jgi:hypothetical protein